MNSPVLVSGSKGSVLFLAYFFTPENVSGSARPYRFYKYLPRFGYPVRVITASTQDPKNAQPNVVCISDVRQTSARSLLRTIGRNAVRRFVAEGGMDFAFLAYDAAEQIVAGEKVRAIFSTSSPVASHFAAAQLKRRYGIPWIADFRDPLAGNPFRKPGISTRIDKMAQAWIFRHADVLLATTDATVELWQRQNPAHAGKMHVIWNGFDPDNSIQPTPIARGGHRLLVHAGAIYGIRDPSILLASIHRLIQAGLLSAAGLQVQLIGPLDDAHWRDQEMARDLIRMGCLQCDGQKVPKKQAEQAIAGADALILLDLHVEGGAVQVPAKVFDYVRIGRPIVAVTTRDSPVDRLLRRCGVPYTALYPEDSAEEIDRKMLHFLRLPSEPVVASPWFWKEFDAVGQARELAALIDSI